MGRRAILQHGIELDIIIFNDADTVFHQDVIYLPASIDLLHAVVDGDLQILAAQTGAYQRFVPFDQFLFEIDPLVMVLPLELVDVSVAQKLGEDGRKASLLLIRKVIPGFADGPAADLFEIENRTGDGPDLVPLKRPFLRPLEIRIVEDIDDLLDGSLQCLHGPLVLGTGVQRADEEQECQRQPGPMLGSHMCLLNLSFPAYHFIRISTLGPG